jgi:Cytochrome P460
MTIGLNFRFARNQAPATLTAGFAVPYDSSPQSGSESQTSKQSAEEQAMKTTLYGVAAMVALVIAVVGGRSSSAQEKQDKYTLQIPGGLAFSEIRGYEQWQVVGPSLTEAANVIRVILANPVMIKAYQEGVPGNGKPFPDGSKIVKLEWRPKKITDPPFSASTPDTVPGDLDHVSFIVKDSTRFSDTHGWGYAMFKYDAASGTFAPGTTASKPPVGHDAKCGAACHTLAASKDYIFTAYPKR